ncbi:MAG TPA: hypothetical protein VJ792_02345 [Candidatus Nitrosotalea sp.]|nr:hypothetical protein [Candidatus Nitrosotalea sp.]
MSESLAKKFTMIFAVCGLAAYVLMAGPGLGVLPGSIFLPAYGQVPDPTAGPDTGYQPTDAGSPDAAPDDNSTDPGLSLGDNSTGIPDGNDTAGGQDMENPDAASQIANPLSNDTSSNPPASQSVPEFGPLPALVLGASIVGALMLGQKALFRL